MAYSIDLSGRVAFITGASSGLGAQFAQTLARAGAAVVLASRRVERLKDLRARIEADGGDAHVVELDVTDHHSIKSAVARAETEVGSIDILINNSGVSTTQRIQDVTEADFDFTFRHQCQGRFLCGAGGGQAHAGAGARRCAGHLHRRAHRQHRLRRRPARAAADQASMP